MNYNGVRTLFGDSVTVDKLTMQKDGIIQSQSSYSGLIKNLIIEGVSTLANIGGGSKENNAGGNLSITSINFNGENSQINLGGDVTADSIESLTTSRIVTNNFDLNNKTVCVSESASLNTTLTIVKTAEMTPESLMVIGFEPNYIIGTTLDKNSLTVMEENLLSGDAVMYKKGATGEEKIENVWLKKTDFDVEIIKDGTKIDGLTFPTTAGFYTVKITCGDLTFEQEVNVIHPSEEQGDIIVSLTEIKEPQISMYKNDESNNCTQTNSISKPKKGDFVPTLFAILDLPDGYAVENWYLNGEIIEGIGGVLLSMPLSEKKNIDMLQPGENVLSVIIKKDSDYESAAFEFEYSESSENQA